MMKPCKIRVPNERVHVLIQEKLFRLGFTWAEGQKTVLNDLAKNNYILTVSTNIFYSPSIEGEFNTSDSKEISYQDFLALPEPNEQINNNNQKTTRKNYGRNHIKLYQRATEC